MVNFLSNRKISIKKYTNVLITINQEDYNIAKDKFRAKNTKLINDVGTNLGKFKPLSVYEKLQLREKLGFQTNDFIIIYVAKLVKNKRQEGLIKAVQQIKNKKLKLLLIGQGKEYFNYINLSKMIIYIKE
ncbi:MAG: glycosyltransferase [Francisella endosymbiont of Hyalomma asiaticum]